MSMCEFQTKKIKIYERDTCQTQYVRKKEINTQKYIGLCVEGYFLMEKRVIFFI